MREFKIAKGWAVFIYITAPLLIALFCWLLIMPFVPGTEDDSMLNAYWLLGPMAFGMIVLMTLGLIDTYKSKFVIAEDKIYCQGVFSNRELLFEEIKGYRSDEYYVYVEAAVEGKKRIKVSNYYGRVDEVVEWLDTYYPELDSLNAALEEERILQDEELGWTVSQREGKLAGARKKAKVLNWAGGLAAAWAIFWPQPYELAIWATLALPVLALFVLKSSDGLIRIDERKDSAYPSVFWAILGPALGLLLRAVADFEVYEYRNVWMPAIVIALTFIAAFLIGNKEFKFKKLMDYFTIFSLSGFVFAYGFGAVVTLNCLYDTSEPAVYQATVLSKSISSGKTTSYYLELTPWGPRQETEEVSVTKDQYEQLEESDVVLVYLMSGEFDIPWFVVSEE